jgi:ubiquinone biosynthesis protein
VRRANRSSRGAETVNDSGSRDANGRPVVRGRSFGEVLLQPIRLLSRWILVSWLLSIASIQWFWATIALRFGWRKTDPRPRILRNFLERTGGTWIKLGQILAMRSDFLPPEMIDELSKLLDKVPPFPYEIARKTIEEDFGRSVEELFADFPTTPIAAASFGQVYRAQLHTGETVAVKVMRPSLKTIIRADLLELRVVAAIVDTLRLLGGISFDRQVDQLEKILYEEIDYHYEADNIRRAVEFSRYMRIMKIPQVVEGMCTSRVLTMEFLQGIWMNELLAAIRENDEEKLEEFERRGLRREVVARRMFDIGMRQLFEVGSFHADPHAANIVVLEDNIIGYVDFGIVGQMDEELAGSQSRYLQAVKDGRIADAARALSESVVVPEKTQNRLPEFRARLGNQVRDWIVRVNDPDAPLRQKSIAQLLLDNIRMIRSYGFELMENTMRYYRALIISDVTVLQLDPDFDTVRGLRRYFRNREIRHLRKTASASRDVAWTAAQYFELWLSGPRLASQLARYLRRNEEEFGVVAAQYTAIWRNLSRGSFLLMLAVLAAAWFFKTPDIGEKIRFPISLYWYWFAPFLLACWRIASVVSR